MVITIHQKSPTASLDDWLEEASRFNENFQSFMLSGHLDHEFYDVDVVMQVIPFPIPLMWFSKFYPRIIHLSLFFGD